MKDAHSFICHHTYPSGRERVWSASWELIDAGFDNIEMRISGAGSAYTAVVGSSSAGRFLYLPDCEMGCPLASLEDSYWNYERISGHLCETDAVTIAGALRDCAGWI